MAKFLSILIISFMSISSLYAQSSTTTQHSDGTYSYEFDMGNGSSNTMNSDLLRARKLLMKQLLV